VLIFKIDVLENINVLNFKKRAYFEFVNVCYEFDHFDRGVKNCFQIWYGI